jgi:hypothetical protein
VPRAPTECDVNLLRARLRSAAPVKSALHDVMHLIEPPARSRSAPTRLRAAMSLILFQAKFHLRLIHAHEPSDVGRTNTGGPTIFSGVCR